MGFKEVRARVDTHWKKSDNLVTKRVTRTDSQRNGASAAVATVKETTAATAAAATTATAAAVTARVAAKKEVFGSKRVVRTESLKTSSIRLVRAKAVQAVVPLEVVRIQIQIPEACARVASLPQGVSI